MNINDVFGGFGAGTKVTALGKEWTFVFDVPAIAGMMEEMCKSWHRKTYEAELAELPERNIPGSFDDRQATKLWEEFRTDLKNKEYRIAGSGMQGGRVYKEWVKTADGKVAGLLAALQIKHPDATMQTLAEITNDAPDQIQAIVVDLGNALRAATPKMVAALKSRDPQAAKYLTEKMAEMEATLTGSPA